VRNAYFLETTSGSKVATMTTVYISGHICSLTLYVVPVATSILLLWFNGHGFYIGGELSERSGDDDWKLFGLQVAAIVLWLLIVASLFHMLSRIIFWETTNSARMKFSPL
jgi:hypothetical protein